MNTQRGIMTLSTRIRWRAASAAGITAALTAAFTPLAVPAQAAESGSGYTVTVQPPGPGSPAGEIASGTVNGKSWKLVESKHCSGYNGPCVSATGAAMAGSMAQASASGLGLTAAWIEVPDSTAPVALLGNQAAPGGAQVHYGPVKADVADVTVSLTNSTVLTLHPVSVFGARGVGFAAPAGATIVSATAYAADGSEIGTAIPFGQPGQPSFFSAWLKPGQRGLARASGVIGSGRGWKARAYVGPWGLCVSYSGFNCVVSAPKRGAVGIYELVNASPPVAMGAVAPGVVRLVFDLPHGKTARADLKKIGGQTFYAAVVSPVNVNNPTLWWTAYYANGTTVRGDD
jgi:hypothetical protein